MLPYNLFKVTTKFSLFLILLLFASFFSIAQNPPTFDLPENDTLFLNSGQNQILIMNIEVGDTLASNVNITAVSVNESLLTVGSISYQFPNKMAWFG